MAKSQKSKTPYRSGQHSSNLHTKNRPFIPSRPNTFAKKLVLFIIFLVMIIVIIATLCAFFLKPENLVKNQITSLANDYYENYFYQDSITTETMEKYAARGLSPLTLSDLLTYDHQKNAKYTDYLSEYCDTSSTLIKFYPDPPYSRTSYHTEYTYACNF